MVYTVPSVSSLNDKQLAEYAQSLNINTKGVSDDKLRAEIQAYFTNSQSKIADKTQNYKELDSEYSVLKSSAQQTKTKFDAYKTKQEMSGKSSGGNIFQAEYDNKQKAAEDKKIDYDVAFSSARDSVYTAMNTGGMFA
jgi:hypothetical protein